MVDFEFENGAGPGRDERTINRRGALALAIGVALGLGPGLADPEFVAFAKQGKSRKKSRKRSKGKGKGKDKKKKGGKGGRSQNSRGSGNAIVRTAMKYKGARYQMGGESPSGFDCSGFTWFVYQKATGMDIGRVVKDQWKHGHSVGRDKWQEGDIVFFKNTFERGLSHNGIYIGGGEFIHAENEQTGVVITALNSDYYTKHYAGARRLV